jgi:hypothetical protein
MPGTDSQHLKARALPAPAVHSGSGAACSKQADGLVGEFGQVFALQPQRVEPSFAFRPMGRNCGAHQRRTRTPHQQVGMNPCPKPRSKLSNDTSGGRLPAMSPSPSSECRWVRRTRSCMVGASAGGRQPVFGHERPMFHCGTLLKVLVRRQFRLKSKMEIDRLHAAIAGRNRQTERLWQDAQNDPKPDYSWADGLSEAPVCRPIPIRPWPSSFRTGGGVAHRSASGRGPPSPVKLASRP